MRRSFTMPPLLALLVALAAAGTAGASRHAGSFKFCTDPTFPPLEYTTTSGKIVSFDVDMANALAKTFDANASAVKTAFPGLLAALSAKKCDVVLSGIFITPDRTKQAPAVSYMHTHRVLIVKAGNPKKIHSPNQLKGLVVAVQQGTKYEQYLKAQQKTLGFTLHSYPGDTDAIGQILIGRADVVLSQDTSAAYAMSKHPGKVAIGYLFPQTDRFGLYYRKGDSIGTKISAAIKALKANGTMTALAKKYNIPTGDVK